MRFLVAILAFGVGLAPVSGQQNCGSKPVPNEPNKVCLGSKDVCTQNVTGCCDGLACTGFSFFKRCDTPPVCLEQWHDCETPDGFSMKCCPPLVCAQTPAGRWSCQTDDIGTKKVIIPGSNLKATPAPTPAPTPAKNLNTTTIPGKPVNYNIACASGDPHIYTFDGLKFDCQSEGEHILLMSTITQRTIQGYLQHYRDNIAVSMIRGVVIQDEGITPRVQIQMPEFGSTPANQLGDTVQCTVMLFIDGVQKNITDPSLKNLTNVHVTLSGSTLTVLYPVSKFQVTISMGFWNNACYFSVCAYVPDVDKVIGIMGTANKNPRDDWTLLNGTQMPMPADLTSLISQQGFAFCNHYCLTNPADSLFIYPERGIDFDYKCHCALPFGSTFEEIIAKVTQDILNICGQNVECLMDGVVGGIQGALSVIDGRQAIAGTCNSKGGECEIASCCEGLDCIDTGFNGKYCGDTPSCAVNFADCSTLGCCNPGLFQCVTTNLGKQCQSIGCHEEWQTCTTNADCCDTLTCTDNLKGGMQCRLLPTCMGIMDDCSQVGCCDGMQCVGLVGGSKQCQKNPTCLSNEWARCDTIPCCEGLWCILDQDTNLNVCAQLPDCEDIGGDCRYVDCCDNAEGNTFCADVVDSKGRAGKQCKLQPVDLTVRVFDDSNANGQYDAGENGLTGITIRLVLAVDGTGLPNQNDGGNAYQSLRTDSNGLATFTKVPRGTNVAVSVTYPPGGAAPTTFQKPGVSDDLNSDLQSPSLSVPFTFTADSPATPSINLGYLMPNDATFTAFADANANGVLDVGEKLLSGVRFRLIRDADGQFLTDQKNGGCAHWELTTTSNGQVTFTKAPQNIFLRLKATYIPVGAVATNLQPDLTTTRFSLSQGSSYVFNSTMVGLILPESVSVRVWNDANSNGIQDDGEPGIQGVYLRLLNATDGTFLVDKGYGGTAAYQLATDATGIATFTKVPIDVPLRVKVTVPPPGAIASPKGAGNNPDLDSDLGLNDTSDVFTLTGTEAGGTYTSTDLGYRTTDTVVVRVWDDQNANGLQDDGEPGIAGVWLRLSLASTNTWITNGNGGNANQQLVTSSLGIVTFTKVPQGVAIRVNTTSIPKGAIATNLNAGSNSSDDSDMRSDFSTEAFIINSTVGDFNQIDMGFRMPVNITVRVWDDADGDGLQSPGESGISGVKLRLITDIDKKFLVDPGTGGNCGQELTTDVNGLVTFNKVPRGIKLRVKVTTGPGGAVRTTPNVVPSVGQADMCGTEALETYGSVDNGASGDYSMMPVKITKVTDTTVSFMIMQYWRDNESVNWISTFYTGSDAIVRCPNEAAIAVQTSEYTALCDPNTGVSTIKVFVAHDKFDTPNIDSTIPALCQISSDPTNKVAFTFDVPCGCPALATDSAADRAQLDSDLNDDGTSDPFDLSSLSGTVFDSINLGFRMPNDVSVRIWDDLNGDGVQDYTEKGIQGVALRFVTAANNSYLANQNNGGTAHLQITSDVNGFVNFTKVPKGVDLRLQVINQPGGAVPTTKLADGTADGADSDLAANGYTDSFNLNSFNGKTFGAIALGFRMPSDVTIRVWSDVNGNGIQDAGEPGIQGVQLRMAIASNNTDLPNIVGGSTTCHYLGTTDANGTYTFFKCPKALDLRVRVANAPAGSVPTTLIPGDQSVGTNSDLLANGFSSIFNLLSFTGPNPFSSLDLGYQMPKSVVFRVWNDTNKNGIQEDGEKGVNNVAVRLMYAANSTYVTQSFGGTCNSQLTTDGNGRVTFTKCPMGVDLKVKLVSGLISTAKVTLKRQGTNNQINSAGNADLTTDSFRMPATCDALYDLADFGVY